MEDFGESVNRSCLCGFGQVRGFFIVESSGVRPCLSINPCVPLYIIIIQKVGDVVGGGSLLTALY